MAGTEKEKISLEQGQAGNSGQKPGGPMGKGPRGPKPKIKNPGKLFARLMGYILANYKFHIIFVIVGILAGVAANVQGTLFMQTLIDVYILPMVGAGQPDFGPLAAALVRVGSIYAIGAFFTWAYNRVMVKVTQGTLRSLRDDLFTHMESLPVKYFDTHSHGDIMSIYTNDIDTLRQMISQSLPQLFSSVITVASIIISMLVLNIPLTIVTLFMVAVMLFATKSFAGRSGKYFIAQQQDLGKVNGYIEEMMEGQKVVKVFCHEEESKERFRELNEELFESADNANKFANMLGPVNLQLGNLSYVVCAMVGGILALNGIGGFTLGGLASFLTFNRSFNMQIGRAHV